MPASRRPWWVVAVVALVCLAVWVGSSRRPPVAVAAPVPVTPAPAVVPAPPPSAPATGPKPPDGRILDTRLPRWRVEPDDAVIWGGCPVRAEDLPGEATLVIPGSGTEVQTVEIRDGHLWLPTAVLAGVPAPTFLVANPGHGTLIVPGYAPAEISWATDPERGAFVCTPDPLELVAGETVIEGVAGDPGAPAMVVGCGGFAEAASDGSFRMEVGPTDPCVLQARRQGSACWGPPVEVDIKPGETAATALPLAVTPGRLMVLFERDAGAWVVRQSWRNDDLVRPGDVLLAARGEPLTALGLEEVRDTILGDEGEVVEVRLRRGTHELTVEAPLVGACEHRDPMRGDPPP